jgi:hypothetical protein
MNKTKIFLCAVFILFFAGAIYLLYAQEQFSSNNPEYLALSQKLDALALDVRKTNAEVLKKLDQILGNQDRILKELDVVRIRASRSR